MDQKRNKMLLEIKHKIKEYNTMYKKEPEKLVLCLIVENEHKQGHNEMEVSDIVLKELDQHELVIKNRFKTIMN
jgi:hypothetical protein